MSLPPLFAQIASQEGWSLQELQQAWAFVPLGSGLVALATGIVLRRHPDRWVLVFAGVLAVLGILLRAIATTPLFLSGSLLLFGAGTGAMLVALTSRVARLFDGERAGVAQAAFFGAYTLGAALGLVTAEGLANQLGGWRGVSGIWALLSVIALIPALRESMPPASVGSNEPDQEPIPATPGRGVARYAFVYAAYVGGYLGIVGLFPYQLRKLGWDPTLADGALASSTLGFIAGFLPARGDHGSLRTPTRDVCNLHGRRGGVRFRRMGSRNERRAALGVDFHRRRRILQRFDGSLLPDRPR